MNLRQYGLRAFCALALFTVPAPGALLFASPPPSEEAAFLEARALVDASGPLVGAAGTERAIEAIRLYFKAANQTCYASEEAGLIACAQALRDERAQSLLVRLSLLRAAELAHRTGFKALERELAANIRADTDDPVSRRVLRKRALLDAPDLHFLVKAATTAATLAERRAGLADLREAAVFSDDLAQLNQAEVRKLIQLADLLSDSEIAMLKNRWPAADVVSSANLRTYARDGVFLIRSGAANRVTELATKFASNLTRNPQTLESWVQLLQRLHATGVARQLIEQFPQTARATGALCAAAYDLLQPDATTARASALLFDCLERHPLSLRLQDRVVERLIGPRPGDLVWAPDETWTEALKRIPAGAGRGRILYWNYRRLKAEGDDARASELARRFYLEMPGSFYAEAFWELTPDGDYEADWRRVKDRETYLEWISAHGANRSALDFLHKQDISRYLDVRGQSAWRQLQRVQGDIAPETRLFARLKEMELAREFQTRDFARIARREDRLAALAEIGAELGDHKSAVYYTRELLRLLRAPEDPFSLPPELLHRLYPEPYGPIVADEATRTGLSPAVIYAVMRQESLFDDRAVSRSGARGLMQIMPRTGEILASSLRLAEYDLFHPETNIRMGARFLADLRRSQGDLRWMSIAYNGGPGALGRWKAALYQDDFYRFLEDLPAEEPRNYCRIVVQNYRHYQVVRALYGRSEIVTRSTP